MFKAFPLFIIPLVAYNLLLLTGDVQAALSSELFSVDLISGAVWSFSVHDAFVVGGVLILYFEIFKSTRTGIASVLDHTLSTVVFVVFLVEFLTVSACGTSTFFVLGLMALLDVIAGFTVSIVAARRDFGVNNPGFGGD
jgi:hypothetical protein